MFDEATREALAAEAKAEAKRRGLVGDAFWAFVNAQLEEAMIEAGMLSREQAEFARPAAC